VITDVLLDRAAVVPAALVVVALMCIAIGSWALRSRRRGPRVVRVLAVLSVLPVAVLTLAPSGRSSGGVGGCTVQFALPGPGTVEQLANVALFLPPVFFAVLASHRPVVVLAAASGVSALIESVQALVPALGRACDTNDWAMNSLGAATGVLLAAGTTALAGRVRSGPAADERT